jgi:hypothetical protein
MNQAQTNPLTEWALVNVIRPARAAFKGLIAVTCDECDGYGRDEDFDDGRCPFCSNGRLWLKPGDDGYRKAAADRLKRVGLNPDAFDDAGNLIDCPTLMGVQ